MQCQSRHQILDYHSAHTHQPVAPLYRVSTYPAYPLTPPTLQAEGPASAFLIIMLFPRRLLRPISSCLLLTAFTSAINLDCSDIRDNNQSWNLKSLGGPHSVKWVESHPPVEIETTVTVDVCKPLQVPKKVAKNEYCPNGTRGEHVRVIRTRVPDAICYPWGVREGIFS